MKQNSAKIPLFLLTLGIVLALVLAVTGVGRHPLSNAPATASAASSGGNGTDLAAAGPDDAAVSNLVLQRCGTCHSINRLANRPQDANGWAQTVAQMQQMGAQVAPQEVPILVNYLATHYGPQS